jgi:hypothetical protein
MPDIAVRCDDPGTAAWITGWLRAGRLAPPVPLEFRVTVTDGLDIPDDARVPFLQPTVAIRSGPPLAHTSLRWRRGEAVAVLPDGAAHAELTLVRAWADRRADLEATFLVPVLVFLLRRAGWHHVHAATAADPSGRGWLFAGNAQDGKSTTAARLATLGWTVGGDDLVFLAVEDGRVVAYPRRAPLALRAGGLALLGRVGGVALPARGKTAFAPEDLGGRAADRVVPEIVAFPRVRGSRTGLTWLPRPEVLAGLVRWSAWVLLERDLAQPHLDLLALLAAQARGARLELAADLFQPGDRLLELVA